MVKNEMIIRRLNCLLRNYAGVKKLIVATKNRLQALNPDLDVENSWIIYGQVERKGGQEIRYQGLKSIKGKISREIREELKHWDIWTRWMENIPGIGPYIAGNLILLYYYRFVPVCKKCGVDLIEWECPKCKTKAKGEGILQVRIDYTKDFRQVSSWWHYLGRHGDKEGNMPKLKKNQASSWSSKGRAIAYDVGDQFNRQTEDHPYRAHLLKCKAKHVNKNDDRDKPWSKGHIQNAGRHEAAKLFLSHFWHVARVLEGKGTSGPWVIEHGGHNTWIPPYFWNEPV